MLRCNSAKHFRFFLHVTAKQMQAIIVNTETNPHRPHPINTFEQAWPVRHGWDSIVQPRQTQTPAISAYVIPMPVNHVEPPDCNKMLAASIAINPAEPKTCLSKSVPSSDSACQTIDLQYENFHRVSLCPGQKGIPNGRKRTPRSPTPHNKTDISSSGF